MAATPLLSAVKRLGVTAAVIVVAAALTIAIVGWGWVKPYVTNRVSEALGRELSIGQIDLVQLSLTPRIHLEGVRLKNAVWSDKPYMLKVRRLAFNIDLLNLILGRAVLSNVEVQQPRLHLAVSQKGTPNWAFITGQGSSGESLAGKPMIPIVAHWEIDNGRVTYRNPRSDTALAGTVASAQGVIAGAGRRVSIQGEGRLEGKPWRLTAELDSLLNRDGPQPKEIYARITLGETQAEIDGSIAQPPKLDKFELHFTLEGTDPPNLGQVAPVALPYLPPYRFEGRLTRDGNIWALEKLTANVGVSDLSGDLWLATGSERMRLRANLVSDKIDLVQIFGPAKPRRRGPVIADTAIDVSLLRAFNAKIGYRATRIYVPGATFAHIATQLSLDGGHLTFDPLKFDYLGGTFDSRIEVAASDKPVQTWLDAKLQKLSLNEILAKVDAADQATGVISGYIGLQGEGRSPADFAASADGLVWLVLQDGRIDELLIEKAGLGLIESLSLIDDDETESVSTCTVEGPWCRNATEHNEKDPQSEQKESETVHMRCLIADFKVRDGVMTAQTLVLETADTKVLGSGTIALGSESVDLTLLPHAKDFSLLAGQAPLHIEGGFRDLEVNVSKARIAFSLLTPMEFGTADPADCQQLTRAVRQQQSNDPWPQVED
ncbi:MAG: AsmA family protein [Gammaproteobacteria bacterium]